MNSLFGEMGSLFDDDELDLVTPRQVRRTAVKMASRPATALPKAEALSDQDPLLFISFGSGSSGNSCYVGSRHAGVLVDVGVRPDDIEKAMQRNGLGMEAVKGVLITHDHSDHVRHAYALLRRNRNIPLFCTPRVLNGMLRRHSISSRIRDYHRPIYKEFEFQLAGMDFTPFEVAHDGSDNMGFYFNTPRGGFAIATDMGSVTDRALHYISQARFLVVEANYDARMLADGHYPEYLKKRIAADNGHMDNAATGRLLAQVYTPGLANVFLCHLSHDNNTPELALATVRRSLQEAGVENFGNGFAQLDFGESPLHLVTLPRFDASPLYVLQPREGGK